MNRNQKDCVSLLGDRILAEHGHLVLQIPPYHPELNPIEYGKRLKSESLITNQHKPLCLQK